MDDFDEFLAAAVNVVLNDTSDAAAPPAATPAGNSTMNAFAPTFVPTRQQVQPPTFLDYSDPSAGRNQKLGRTILDFDAHCTEQSDCSSESSLRAPAISFCVECISNALGRNSASTARVVGSCAAGVDTPWSDLDIAFTCPSRMFPDGRYEAICKLAQAYPDYTTVYPTLPKLIRFFNKKKSKRIPIPQGCHVDVWLDQGEQTQRAQAASMYPCMCLPRYAHPAHGTHRISSLTPWLCKAMAERVSALPLLRVLVRALKGIFQKATTEHMPLEVPWCNDVKSCTDVLRRRRTA